MGGVRRLRPHRQLGRPARDRARRGDRRAERSRHAAHDREEPGGADGRRRRVRRATRTSTLLPVLLNDYDANGDVLVVDGGRRRAARGARLDRVSDNQQLQLTLDDAAIRRRRVPATPSTTAGAAPPMRPSTVTVRGPDENAPPVAAARRTRGPSRSAGGSRRPCSATGSIPTGIPFFLRSPASRRPTRSPRPRRASWCSTSAAARARLARCRSSSPTAATSRAAAHGRGARARRRAARRRPVRRARDRRGGDPHRPAPARARRRGAGAAERGARQARGAAHARLRRRHASASRARRAHALPRVHRDRRHRDRDRAWCASTCRHRPTATPRRSPVPHTAFLRAEQPIDVDVLATDIDPTGGVLIVTGVTDPADDDGVRVEVVDHRVLRVTLTRPLATGSTTFGYRVSNGLAEAEGEVTVVEVPEPERTQPPVAAPDTDLGAHRRRRRHPRARQRRAPRRAAAHARGRPGRRSRRRASSSSPATGCGTSRPSRRASSRRCTASTRPTASTRRRRCTSRCARPTRDELGRRCRAR